MEMKFMIPDVSGMTISAVQSFVKSNLRECIHYKAALLPVLAARPVVEPVAAAAAQHRAAVPAAVLPVRLPVHDLLGNGAALEAAGAIGAMRLIMRLFSSIRESWEIRSVLDLGSARLRMPRDRCERRESPRGGAFAAPARCAMQNRCLRFPPKPAPFSTCPPIRRRR